MDRKVWILSTCIILLVLGVSYGQEEERVILTEQANFLEGFGAGGLYFFSALVAGVLIALALYMLLTTLAAAVGLSAVHPEKAIAPHHGRHREEDRRKDERHEDEGGASSARKAVHAMGLGALIVGVISMFFASWFGVELSQIENLFIGMVMGLSIWGLTYLLLMALEARAISSAAGSLYHAATSGMSSAGRTVGGLLAKSPEDRIEEVVRDATQTVRDEIFGDVDTHKLHKELNRYIHELKPASPKEIARELRNILDDTELEAVVQGESYRSIDIERIRATLEEKGMSKERSHAAANRMRSAIDILRRENAEKDKLSAATDTALEMAGKSRQQAEEIRGKIEEYLRNTNKEQLNPEGIKRDVEKLFSSPREGMAALKQRFGSIDKSTATAVLEQRSDISHQEAEKIVDNVEKILTTIRTQVSGGKEATSGSIRENQQKLESKVRNYMDSLGRPELRYQGVKEDVKLLFHDPKAGSDRLIQRMKAMDRDTFKALLASRRDISEEDAEHIIERMEGARDDVISKAERMKERVREEVDRARQKAADATAEVRKTASAASWWSFLAALGSAASAVGGGLLAMAV